MDLEAFHEIIRGERGIGPMLARTGFRATSWLYGCGVRVRNWAYDRGWKTTTKAAVPVISVGNLTVGGTGKTPCVEYIARFLRGLDRRVCILSRGYGAEQCRNDEALVLEENLPDVPHLQGADRVELAKIAVEELESDILVLDDGFQHRRLGRDLDIVLIDATCPWGYGYLLPRGLLREPSRGLRRGHVVLITRSDLVGPEALASLRTEIERLAPGLDIVECTHEPAEWVNASRHALALDVLKNRNAAAFCGLGNPAGFRQTLEQIGLKVVAWQTFPDHHGYTREDIDSLRSWAHDLPAETVVVTTQKDLVKIRLDRLADKELWALKIRLHLGAGKDVLERRLSVVSSP